MQYYRLAIKIPKSPWRWLRFRLLTILLLTTIVALIFAWRRDHLQQLAIEQQLRTHIFSLENPGPNWGTDEVKGPPNTITYGDQSTAWASKTQDGQQEWLVLEFASPVLATAVQVHENYNPGALNKISHFL